MDKIGVFRGYPAILIGYEQWIDKKDTVNEDVVFIVRPYYDVYLHDVKFGHFDINSRQMDRFDEVQYRNAERGKYDNSRQATPEVEVTKEGPFAVEETVESVAAEELNNNGKIVDDYLRNFNNTMEKFFSEREDILANVGKR